VIIKTSSSKYDEQTEKRFLIKWRETLGLITKNMVYANYVMPINITLQIPYPM